MFSFKGAFLQTHCDIVVPVVDTLWGLFSATVWFLLNEGKHASTLSEEA